MKNSNKRLPSVSKIIVILNLAIISLVFIYSSFIGLDLTDEGYYLLMASQPSNVKVSFSLYYYIAHYLYIISNHNLPLYRILTFSLYLTVSYGLSYQTLKYLNKDTSRNDLIYYSILSSIAGLLVFIFPVLPSYNSLLNLVVMLILILIIKSLNSNSDLNKKLLLLFSGLALGLCLFLKFTSFFILVIMINLLVFYYHDRKLTMRYSILMLGTLPSLFILGLNNNLLESFTNGLQTFTLIDSNHNLGLLWQYTQQFIYLGIMVGLRTIIALPCFILWYKSKKNYLFALGFISGTLLPSVDLSYGASRFLQLSSIGYFWLIVLYVYGYLIEKKVSDKANIPLIICYLCLPYILALGSNNQIYIQILLFFITTMIIIINNLIQINHRLIKNIILLTILLFTSFQLIYEQLSIPYRTANKIHNLVKIKLATLGTIYLNKDLANYITNSLSLLKQCQFKTNDNIIALYDLPSLVYLAGANSYACPWYFNYNGAENMVNFCLNLYPSGLINKSFLILDNDVNLNKFNQILLNYGTSLKQYKYCGKVVAPSVMGMNLKNIKIYAPIVK